MRKLVALMAIIMLVVSSIGICQAAMIQDNSVDIMYIGTSRHFESLTSKTGNSLAFYGQLTPKSAGSYDNVKVTLKVVNFVTNTTVHNESQSVFYDSLGGYFMAKSSCIVPMGGTYYLDVTYKCYKNGVLIETITGVSSTLSV